jgi:hypothetical protein
VPTSIVKVEANRRNAALSTGPRTEEAKAVVARNALRHGLFSTKPVLAGIEREEDWRDHLAGTVASLAPVGHLEQVLAERVALCLWRLGRVARYEHEVTALSQESADEGEAVVATELARAAALRDLLDRLPRLADDEPMPVSDAASVIRSAAAAVGAPPERVEDFRRPRWLPAGTAWSAFDAWTAGRLRECVAALCAYGRRTPDAIWRQLAAAAADRIKTLDRRRADAERLLDRHRRTNLLPGEAETNRITRYEASIERSLFKAQHELQRMQAVRQGQNVPPPVAVDVTGAEGSGGDGAAAACT